MATGRVLRFDETRGYGFIASDDGGEDVFLHANVLMDDKQAYRPGVTVEYEPLKDARGVKATMVRIISPVPSRQPAPTPSAGAEQAPNRQEGPVDDDILCDVLPAVAFRKELVNLCLQHVPSMTGQQINELNDAMLRLARSHGWVED